MITLINSFSAAHISSRLIRAKQALDTAISCRQRDKTYNRWRAGQELTELKWNLRLATRHLTEPYSLPFYLSRLARHSAIVLAFRAGYLAASGLQRVFSYQTNEITARSQSQINDERKASPVGTGFAVQADGSSTPLRSAT